LTRPRRLWRLPAHWRLLGFCLLVVAMLILFEGYATHTIGASAEPHDVHGTAPLAGSRPILTVVGGRLVSRQAPPGRRIALTFDDGPDPRWTPQIAEVLRDAHVHATFFVVGSAVARHPGLVRELFRDGNEIGNHTFTHVALSNGPLWQRRLQLELTEAAIVGATGHYTRLIRPPYSATSDAVTPSQAHALAQDARDRYLIVLANFDSEDWQKGAVPGIVRRASPPGTTGGVVMFHDGGGDRKRTVEALRLLIPQLQARGFTFVTVSQLAGLPTALVSPTAKPWERRRGDAFAWAVRLAFRLVWILGALILAVGLLVAARVVLVVGLATWHKRRAVSPSAVGHLPEVVVVVPAYNESVGIEAAVRSLASSEYPHFEVVVVDDGSSDDTAEIVERLALDNVRLIRKENGGKASALNTGIANSTAPVVVMVDGDTLFEPSTIVRLVQPLADERVGAVSGNTKVGNRRGLLGRWQHIEYVTGFNLDRRMYEVLQCTPTVPGAIGAFRRDVLEAVGGVSDDTLAEDTDLTLAIGRTGHLVMYADDARAWTEAPGTLADLWRQRYRWSYGTMQAVWKHKRAVLTRDPKQKRIGRRALPYIFFFQILLLPIIAPLIDLFALYGLLFTNPVPVIAYWVAFNLVQVALAAYAFRMDRESLKPLWALPLQQFVYRQLMYLVIIESTISALAGTRAHWGTLQRSGDIKVAADSSA
jgi:cellulose synthase/poly-beta-1,6-N-acetylglucosamine synthase-like glycosyltransferase/peptidoglycan/xylan/chitin deacetylase (PgdA/CDA1 family)